jgi:hypothetical integral membrane protein (TIGR02206 family)
MSAESGAFHPFATAHWVVLVCAALLVSLVVAVGRRCRSATGRSRVEQWRGWIGVAVWLLVTAWWALPERFGPGWSLPLHMCDLVGLIAPLAYLLGHRWLRALTYFWGLGLSTQAFLTPTLNAGPPSQDFWVFWTSHTTILVLAVCDLAVRGFRPTWRDYGTAVIAAVIYVLVILPINVLFGFNYGYLGNSKPSTATLLDLMGPWPQRVLVMAAIGALLMAIMELPWQLAGAGQKGARD